MRIAYISSDHGIPVLGGKGASIHILEMINAFYAHGHDISLLCARLGEGRESAISADIWKIRASGISTSQPHVDTADDDRRLHKEQRYIDIGWAMEEAIVEHHAKTPFDFIYERYSLWSAAGIKAARRLGIPCIVEVNAPLLLEQQRYRKLALTNVASEIEAEVFNGADAIVCVSDGVRDYVAQKASGRAGVHVVPNGANLAYFNPEVEPANVEGLGDGPVIGFTGSLKPWHGIQDLLGAFRDIHEKMPSSRLLIVGDGPLRDWIEGFAEGSGLKNEIIVTGWADPAELPSLIKRMDVTVAPYPDMEEDYFSPLKLFEYLAVGRPIVASALGQINQVITDRKNGLLSKPGDRSHLARNILEVLQDKDLQTILGLEAAKTALEYSWPNNAWKAIGMVKAIAANQKGKVVANE